MVQLMPLHPETQSSIASFKSRLVLPFWYWLTQVVLLKKPLNGCSSSSTGLLTKGEINYHFVQLANAWSFSMQHKTTKSAHRQTI